MGLIVYILKALFVILIQYYGLFIVIFLYVFISNLRKENKKSQKDSKQSDAVKNETIKDPIEKIESLSNEILILESQFTSTKLIEDIGVENIEQLKERWPIMVYKKKLEGKIDYDLYKYKVGMWYGLQNCYWGEPLLKSGTYEEVPSSDLCFQEGFNASRNFVIYRSYILKPFPHKLNG